MALRDDWMRARAVAWKDLTAERRSKAGFNSVAALGITILVLFGFALGPDAEAVRAARAIGSELGRQVLRGVLGSILGKK